ncbi:MAG: lysophospholipid acyltransferase family protein [Magnetococcales bacterium]|nr:lysophospholipid acyltransferase family protein [Magnetococcales bacterium]
MLTSLKKLSLSHTLEWLALRGVLAWVRHGELPAAARQVRWLARHAPVILRSEWAWTRTNLRLIYGPDLSGPRLDRLATLVFENIFLSHLEGLRVRDCSCRWEGLDILTALHARGRGVILTSTHLGSWEPALKHGADAGLPLVVVYRHANNPLSEREFTRVRADYGVEMVRRKETRATVRAITSGKVLALMVDINTRQGGVTAPFLGVPAQCPSGPARLASRHGCPVVPVAAIRQAPGMAVIRVGTPLEPPPATASPGELDHFTGRINAAFAPWILEWPEQYNWLHARWRSRPDGSLWRTDTPVETLWQARVAPHPPLPDRVLELIA